MVAGAAAFFAESFLAESFLPMSGLLNDREAPEKPVKRGDPSKSWKA
jgi:hypothetical protein